MYVFKIADSYLVLKGKSVLPAERERARNVTFDSYASVFGATFESFDAERSLELGKELPRSVYAFEPKNFYNGLKDNREQEQIKRRNPDYVFTYADFNVRDDEIPRGIRSAGVRIYNACEIYKLKYNSSAQRFDLTDENGRTCRRNKNHAESDGHSVKMFLEMYAFEKADYLRLRQIYASMGKNKTKKLDLAPRDKALLEAWKMVSERVKSATKQKPYTLCYELTHIRNKFRQNIRNLASNRGKLTTEDVFRLSRYDEKSAHLAENLKAINLYLEKNNPYDFSMFPEKSRWLVRKLEKTPVLSRKALLSDNRMLWEGTSAYWDKMHGDGYLGQFACQVRKWAETSPLSYMGQDTREYKKRRSDMLSFERIDPISGRRITVDFSDFITNETAVSKQVRASVIEPAEKIIGSRRDKLNRLGIVRSVVGKVQQLHRFNNLKHSLGNGYDGR